MIARPSFPSRKRVRRQWKWISVCLAGWLSLQSAASGAAAPSPTAGAENLLLEGRADEAASVLKATLAADPANALGHLLLCRVYLSEEMGSQAAGECQASLAHGLDKDSNAQDWTGRALGAQASHAGIFTGMKLAPKVRTAFEAAVALNPSSEAACVDLGEFYTSAPAIIGGGTTRALDLASRTEATLPETAHRIRAMAAEKDNDLETAEREFGAEVAVAQRPGAMVDLAAFYGRHKQPAKAIATARKTIAADREIDATVVEAAGLLDDAHQTVLAEEALRSYLEHGHRSDRAPAFRVHTQLGTLLLRSGDKQGARSEFQRALALASQYGPAQKGLGSL